MMLLVIFAQLGPAGVQAQEPSIVPHLLNPGRAQNLVTAPGGQWAFARPRDAVDIGQDAASQTLSLGLPVGRMFCELRLTTVALPTGTAGSLALSFTNEDIKRGEFDPVEFDIHGDRQCSADEGDHLVRQLLEALRQLDGPRLLALRCARARRCQLM